MAAAAAAAAAPPAPAAAPRQQSTMVPFVRPGSANLLSVDDQVPSQFVAPPPSGRTCEPLFVPAAPVAFGACTGDAWRATATYIDVNAGVADCFAGLNTEECHQEAYSHLGGPISALDAAAASLSPPTAARTLRSLAAEAGPALALVAPGGTSALATLPACQLPHLFQSAAACATELATGSPSTAIDTALAALQLMSHLRFGSAAAAEPYAAASHALKAALAAAARSPAAAISERQVLCLVSACARADSHLWLAPWVSHRWTAATEARLTAGWSSGEAAVQYLESWCALVARGRLHFAAAKFQAAAEAAVGHELSTAHLNRLLAAEAALPAHLTTTVNAWLAGWTADVSGHRNALVRAQAKAAAGTAARTRRAAAHSVATAVELAQGAPAVLAYV